MKHFVEKKFKALGTDIFLKIVCEKSEQKKAEESLLEAQKMYFKYHKQLSRFDRESEISKINSFLNKKQEVSREILNLARQSVILKPNNLLQYEAKVACSS